MWNQPYNLNNKNIVFNTFDKKNINKKIRYKLIK